MAEDFGPFFLSSDEQGGREGDPGVRLLAFRDDLKRRQVDSESVLFHLGMMDGLLDG